jgi:hypothetical protein
MIVPQFWAESRLQHRDKNGQVTMRRFGWSDVRQSDAQSNADARVKEAFGRMLAGEKLARKDPKIPYNGASGLPIREEIISRHCETVVTRNSYGARCLNPPNLLFADVDFPDRPAFWLRLFVFCSLNFLALAIGWITSSLAPGIALGLVSLFLAGVISNVAFRAIQAARGGPEGITRTRITRFLSNHPNWSLRLYRTPAGMRIAGTHKLFSPHETAVTEFFDAIGTDPIYAAMCRNQHCFKARVSAKPWRIGLHTHLRPRPGVWPVSPDRVPDRNGWIADYENAAGACSACAFLESMGSGNSYPVTEQVLELHDHLCRATAKLIIA